MTRRFRRYLDLWIKLSTQSFLSVLSSRISAGIFLLGKILRFIFFLFFLAAIFNKTKTIAHYSLEQAALFFLTFNLIDTASQLFFREVYRFRYMVVTGDFDLVLTKPMSPLFRVLVGGADPLDLIMLVPYVGGLTYMIHLMHIDNLLTIFFYVILIGNGLLIAAGFHILVLSLGIVTTEIDHTIMIYRDLTSMGRLPVDIYHEPLRSFITFIVPVGIMMTFPARALQGLLTPAMVVFSLIVGALFLVFSLGVWRFALSKYSSASS